MEPEIKEAIKTGISLLCEEAAKTSIEKGYNSPYLKIKEFLVNHNEHELAQTLQRIVDIQQSSMISTEVAEIVGEVRAENNKETVALELADVIIRACEYAHHRDIRLKDAIAKKLEYNRTRPTLNGKSI